MGLIFRSSSLANTGATSIKNAPLTFLEGDGNFAWLATNLSGSVVEISGSVTLSGSFSIPTLTTTAQSNVVTVDTATGRLYYTSSTTVGAGSVSTGSLLATASIATNVITFTKGDNSTFALTVNTGSFVVTGSVSSNTLTFTKGDNTTFSLLVATGSGASISTGSFLITGSVSNNTITFTKGDNTTFALVVDTGSAVAGPISVTGSTLYSNNPLTGELSPTNTIAFGVSAGSGSTAADDAVFLGKQAGQFATNAANSVIVGERAGADATNASASIFLGTAAGRSAADANNSVIIGASAGFNGIGNSVGPYNIIIGQNVTLPNAQSSSLNIGGAIFATGLYQGNTPISSSVSSGLVGINKTNPQYQLDVSGSVRASETLRSGTDVIVGQMVTVGTVARLTELDPLPSGNIGELAVSASNLWFYSGSAWRQVQLI